MQFILRPLLAGVSILSVQLIAPCAQAASPLPSNAAECAAHFGIDASRWALVCRRAAGFYERTAYAHHDPTECVAKARRYTQAAEVIQSGIPPEDTHVPGVGIPAGTRSPGVARLRYLSN